eukprot:TRINITY_DN1593_c0_g1_i1.p1 TRINITY_DN1593_c0_g1~~TRINITY_DN1593_c0_g1_i1.p1  ORF type:complete len:459 (+),score=58.99 TRINITY_DN1593_c0_g1_i1:44-1420(+)
MPSAVWVGILAAWVSAVSAQRSLPTVLDDTTLLFIDERITRSYDCVTEEETLLANESTRMAAELCYVDQCLCRGGEWDSDQWKCSHKCDRVTCPPKTCRVTGTCLPNGNCHYTHAPDGTVCEPVLDTLDGAFSALRDVHGASPPPHRCYFGLCLPHLTCGGVQCPLPENECYEAACVAIVPEGNATGNASNMTGNASNMTGNATANATAPPEAGGDSGEGGLTVRVVNNTGCHLRPRTGGACDGGRGKCAQGVCAAVTVEKTCADVICPPSQHMCRRSVGCVEGACAEENAPDGTACDDYNPRTTNDHCQHGSCYGEIQCGLTDDEPLTVCTPSSPECVSVGCNGGGGCLELNKPDGATCSDGDPHTAQDFCLSGRCVGATPYYGCENHARCLPTFYQCMARQIPSCIDTYLTQCRKVAESQMCPSGGAFCVAASAAALAACVKTALALAVAALLLVA